MRLHEVIENRYPEIEFVCHNENYSDSTHLDSQQALERDLRNMEGVVVLRQDWSNEHDGRQISLSAIVLDRSLLQQVKAAAKRHGVEIDMVNKVNDDYVNRAIRGEHEGQIREGRFHNAALAGIAAASLAGAMNTSANIQKQAELDKIPQANIQRLIDRPPSLDTKGVDWDAISDWWAGQQGEEPEAEEDAGYDINGWATAIAAKYRINPKLAQTIVELAVKHEDEVFPKAADILAVIGVESSFNPKAVSRLRHDPARGLMQVRPGIWKIDPKELNDIEKQIEAGVYVLKRYYGRAGSAEGALHAYNIGITSYRKGKKNPAYVAKVEREKSFLASVLDGQPSR